MKNQARRRYNPQSGSIFVWIFVMIALFGALSYAMSRSSRTGASTIAKEQAQLAAADIITYANQISQAVKTITINGCRVTQLSFANPIVTGAYNNATSPSNKSCHVFEPVGGGLRIVKFPEEYFANLVTFPSYYYPMFHGNGQVSSIGTACANATCNELMMSVADIKPEVCFAINKQLGIPVDTIGEQVENWGFYISELYDGTFYNAGSINNSIGNENGNILKARKMGCMMRHDVPPYNVYEFYAVLVAQ